MLANEGGAVLKIVIKTSIVIYLEFAVYVCLKK